MRRIPRPQRAIDPVLACSLSPRYSSLSSPCRTVLRPYTHPPALSAAFSTSPSRALLFSGKQDKKKHQQFVRRWQKRLLGDSEPIGAHVDPYDPTSPVRISPEEQGEEVETLAEADIPHWYQPAQSGRGLRHVGSEEWLAQMEESALAKEFEKLTLRTYTPMTNKMANEVEDLTGTPYTLRHENLAMAQAYYNATGKPYTDLSWGRHSPINKTSQLRKTFRQAVAEIYALKQAGQHLDMSTFPNQGVYKPADWVYRIKLYRKENGEFALLYPRGCSSEAFLEMIGEVPDWEPVQLRQEEDLDIEEEIVDDMENDTTVAQPEAPTMDSETPQPKRAALVKQDTEKKFDFMSNRPVPRAKPVENTSAEESTKQSESTDASNSTVTGIQKATAPTDTTGAKALSDLEASAMSIQKNVSAARRAIRDSLAVQASESVTESGEPKEVKWRDVPLTDIATKFALSKRLLQLTGLHIADPHLTSVESLGDLYGHLCAAAKPKPKKLYSTIHIEGRQANAKAKKQDVTSQEKPSRKAGVEELLNLGHVKLHRHKITPTQKYTQTGLKKVIDYAIAERGLGQLPKAKSKAPETLKSPDYVKVGSKNRLAKEGSRMIPEFGRPVTQKGLHRLRREKWVWKKVQRQAKKSETIAT